MFGIRIFLTCDEKAADKCDPAQLQRALRTHNLIFPGPPGFHSKNRCVGPLGNGERQRGRFRGGAVEHHSIEVAPQKIEPVLRAQWHPRLEEIQSAALPAGPKPNVSGGSRHERVFVGECDDVHGKQLVD